MATILIVENSETFRMAVAAVVREKGCGILMAGSGCEGLKTLSREHIDLILLDMTLPDMSGLGFLTAMIAMGAAAVPTITLSSLDDARNLDAARGLGAKHCLVKSCFSRYELLNQVNQQLAA